MTFSIAGPATSALRAKWLQEVRLLWTFYISLWRIADAEPDSIGSLQILKGRADLGGTEFGEKGQTLLPSKPVSEQQLRIAS